MSDPGRFADGVIFGDGAFRLSKHLIGLGESQLHDGVLVLLKRPRGIDTPSLAAKFPKPSHDAAPRLVGVDQVGSSASHCVRATDKLRELETLGLGVILVLIEAVEQELCGVRPVLDGKLQQLLDVFFRSSHVPRVYLGPAMFVPSENGLARNKSVGKIAEGNREPELLVLRSGGRNAISQRRSVTDSPLPGPHRCPHCPRVDTGWNGMPGVRSSPVSSRR